MANKLTSDNFSLLNKDGEAVIFRTDKPELNVLTFSIINVSDEDLLLKGGTLSAAVIAALNDDCRTDVAADVAAATCSFFQFDFESMLTPEVMENMAIEMPENWDKLYTAPAGTKPASWTAGPKIDVTVKPKEEIKIVLSNITCATTRPGNFEIKYGNVPNYTDSRFAITKHMAVQNPVDPTKKTLPLARGYVNAIHPIGGQTKAAAATVEEADPHDPVVPVYITYTQLGLIENGFDYFLKNTTKDPLVPPGSQVDAANPPVLYISFLFGPEDYDITTQALADNNLTMAVTAKTSQWTPMAHVPGTAYWQFLPKSQSVIDGYETVTFPIKQIITELNAAPNDLSLMYVQFNNVPGYNDANYVLPLQKLAVTATIPKVTVKPNKIKFGEDVLLNWETELAWRVTLEYHDRDGNLILLDSQKRGDNINLNMTGFKRAPTLEQTKFILNAYYTTDTPTPGAVDVWVDQPEAQIEFFKSVPMLADVTRSAPITLSWQTNNARQVEIHTPEGWKGVDKNNLQFPYTLQSTTLFTLRASGYGEHAKEVTSGVRVYAYRPGTPLNLPFGGDAMQSWPSVLVNNPRGQVYAADGGNKTIYSYEVKSGALINPTFPGVVMSLSADGTKLFVHNTDGANFGVSIIDTLKRVPSAPVGFGPVYQMLANPGLTKLYCAATHGVNTVTRLLVDANADKLSSPLSITVGTSPRALAFNKDASKLYVANYDSHSVSIINVSNDTVIKTLDITITEPHSFAYHKDKDRLYVACEGSNIVVVIDTNSDTVSKQITVGNRPSTALISPNGKYVYVANFGGNTVSVIDTDKDEVTSTLTVGQAPIAMALNGDGNVFFVGNYCSRSLSVVDINNNIVLPESLPTGDTNGNPFDLAVFTEVSGYSQVYVGKESFKPRIDCATANNGLGVTVYSIQKPGG